MKKVFNFKSLVLCLVIGALAVAGFVGVFNSANVNKKANANDLSFSTIGNTAEIRSNIEGSSAFFTSTAYVVEEFIPYRLIRAVGGKEEWIETSHLILTPNNTMRICDWQFRSNAPIGNYKIVAFSSAIAENLLEDFTIFLTTTSSLTDIYVTDTASKGSIKYEGAFVTTLSIVFNAGASTGTRELKFTNSPDNDVRVAIYKDKVLYNGNKISFSATAVANTITLTVADGLENGLYYIRVSHPSSDVFGEFIIINYTYKLIPDTLTQTVLIVCALLGLFSIFLFFLPAIMNVINTKNENRKAIKALSKEEIDAINTAYVDKGEKAKDSELGKRSEEIKAQRAEADRKYNEWLEAIKTYNSVQLKEECKKMGIVVGSKTKDEMVNAIIDKAEADKKAAQRELAKQNAANSQAATPAANFKKDSKFMGGGAVGKKSKMGNIDVTGDVKELEEVEEDTEEKTEEPTEAEETK
ncbi:MAG: hypothetical protein FWD32_00830 [Firmicutes bacterium]|nr:hypothetical protein [Bacillota bacterium]